MTLLWIQDGEETRWLAEAITGAFQKAMVLKFDQMTKESFCYALEEAGKQGIGVIAISKMAVAMKKELGGLVLLPYGSEVKLTMKGVLIHQPMGKRMERDLIVDKALAFLKVEKVLLKL